MASIALPSNNLIDALAASGAEVLSDPATLDFYAHDVFERGADLAAVVRPVDTQQLAAVVAAATAAGHPVVARGGGDELHRRLYANHAGRGADRHRRDGPHSRHQ
ncbi:MAG: FAD-binding oxidoreductase [Sphingopyxis sp.]|nr:FAD-binding oxidoreductase [Sphingopyxis sp.]